MQRRLLCVLLDSRRAKSLRQPALVYATPTASHARRVRLTPSLLTYHAPSLQAQVHLLEYDEESNSVRAQLYGHKHEVWHVAPSPTNPSLLATCYCDAMGAPRRARPPWRGVQRAAPPCLTVPRPTRALVHRQGTPRVAVAVPRQRNAAPRVRREGLVTEAPCCPFPAAHAPVRRRAYPDLEHVVEFAAGDSSMLQCVDCETKCLSRVQLRVASSV